MKLLFVSHNVPFPPNKGEKIRTYHIIHELAKRHEIHLIALTRDPADLGYQADLEVFCERVELIYLNPLVSKFYASIALLLGSPITLGYFFSLKARRLVKQFLANNAYAALFAICSSGAQYLYRHRESMTLVDYIDIDSAKWKQYAEAAKSPLSWLYALEHRRLAQWERKICEQYDRSLLTSPTEKQRLLTLAVGCDDKIIVCPNGIDTEFFYPRNAVSEPSSGTRRTLVFTGQMDYMPNVDAVKYFYDDILPLVQRRHANTQFVIVGRNPDASIAQDCPNALVTGEVDDIRPFLHQAAVFVSPLRLAFGVQNKVLEAMACAVPVVATSQILSGMNTVVGNDLLVGDDAETFAEQVCVLLDDETRRRGVGQAGYQYVVENHDWSAVSQLIDNVISVDSPATE